MAKVYGQYLGVVKGKMGPSVFKYRKGTHYVGKAPKKYKRTTKEEALRNQRRFAISTKFASVVNDSKYLKSIWYEANLEGKTPYSKIFKFNHFNSNGSFMESLAMITPEGKSVYSPEYKLTISMFEAQFIVKDDVTKNFRPPYVAVLILHLSDPVIKSAKKPDNYHQFITIEQELPEYEFKENKMNTFKFKYAKNAYRIINDYNRVTAFFSIICNENKQGNTDWLTGGGYYIKGFEEFIKAKKARMEELTAPKPEPLPEEPAFNIRIK